jgi:hypothetical protein
MRSHRTKHSQNAGWRTLAGAGLLVTIAVTGCSASPAASSGVAADGQPSTSPAATAPSTPPAGQSSAPAPSASASPTDSGGIQNLVVSSAVRSQLTAAYLTMRQIPASDVSGTQPNGVYYAYDPATNTYWALAEFDISPKAPMDVLVNSQDGGSEGMYTKIGSGPWQVQRGGIGPCVDIQFFPKPVLAAWAFPTSPPAGNSC